eukprot:TRINITY_DN6724_c0_g1_i1.p1 TRINITY_DN6724_c0_g1~~TRINITY_DN6724_c0_g1_i1.p1  ORF type:complete len:351 (-),score=132.84 TRINITY_DN6724_c0_g1_i1:207-1259(-)
MPGSDIIMACVVDGVTTLSDRYATAHVVPTVDRVNDVTLISGHQTPTSTVLRFSRRLDTGDPQDYALVPNRVTYVLYAFSDSPDFNTNHVARGAMRIDLFSGAALDYVDWRIVHGALMLVAFAGLFICGQFYARYMKNFEHVWLQAHIGAMAVGTLLALLGAVLIAISTGRLALHAHALLGLVLLVALLLQPAIGCVAGGWHSAKHSLTSRLALIVHPWLGRLITVGGLVNIFLGLCVFKASPLIWLVYGGWLVLVALVFGYMEYMLRRSSAAATSQPGTRSEETDLSNGFYWLLVQSLQVMRKAASSSWHHSLRELRVAQGLTFAAVAFVVLATGMLATFATQLECALS